MMFPNVNSTVPGERKVLGRIFLVSAFLPQLGLVISGFCEDMLDLIR